MDVECAADQTESSVVQHDDATQETAAETDDNVAVGKQTPGDDAETGSVMSSNAESEAVETRPLIITDAMMEEEKRLQELTIEEETSLRKKQQDEIRRMNENLKEQRFKRLQFLLSKSNMYTTYLVERMNKQREEDQKKQERSIKRRENAALKKQIKKEDDKTEKTDKDEEKEKKKLEMSRSEPTKGNGASVKTEPGVVDKVNDKENSESSETSNSQKSEAESTLISPRRTSKRISTLTPLSSPQNINSPRTRSKGNTKSPGSVSSSQGSQKKGQKRKAENMENYKISDYFDEALARSKKAKTDTAEEGQTQEKEVKTEKEEVKTEKEEVKTEKEKSGNKSGDSKEQEEDSSEVKMPAEIGGEPVPFGQPMFLTGGVLRSYQMEGFNWLRTLYENGINGILADEMGLGKTIQCIASIAYLVQQGVPGPFLVCAPLSTVPNWVSEFERFTPRIPVLLYHGNKDQRQEIRRKMRKAVQITKTIQTYPVVITSYEITMNDRKHIHNMEWRYIIVDEGHRIKNFQCKLIKELKLYQSTHRLLLTGTPLQNNLSELWSLLNFLLPEIFDDLNSFESWFDLEALQSDMGQSQIIAEEEKKGILGMLHQILTPFMLRRLKTDVALNIPPKRETLVFAPLMQKQENFYRAAVEKTISSLVECKAEKEMKVKIDYDEKGRPKRRAGSKKVDYSLMMFSEKDEITGKMSKKEDEELEAWVETMTVKEMEPNNNKTEEEVPTAIINIKLRNTLMLLRKVCNHPYLLEYPLDPKTGDFKIDEQLVKSCGKFLLLDRMLPALKKDNHKVLIFSQMTGLLDILEDYCYLRKYMYCRLDGSMKLEERKEQIDSFNKDKELFIFLVSTRAGGLGINLTAADTVIIYDSDWNPQADLQAQDRCHRIGQTRPVMVYRLVTANTIDHKIVERASCKRKLEKIVIHKGKFKKGLKNFKALDKQEMQPLNSEELLKLLQSTDYDEVVRAREGQVISNKDLQKLLDRSGLYKKWNELKERKRQKEEEGKECEEEKEQIDEGKLEGVEGVFKVISEDSGDYGSASKEIKNDD